MKPTFTLRDLFWLVLVVPAGVLAALAIIVFIFVAVFSLGHFASGAR
jgi:hypothetical protein